MCPSVASQGLFLGAAPPPPSHTHPGNRHQSFKSFTTSVPFVLPFVGAGWMSHNSDRASYGQPCSSANSTHPSMEGFGFCHGHHYFPSRLFLSHLLNLRLLIPPPTTLVLFALCLVEIALVYTFSFSIAETELLLCLYYTGHFNDIGNLPEIGDLRITFLKQVSDYSQIWMVLWMLRW